MTLAFGLLSSKKLEITCKLLGQVVKNDYLCPVRVENFISRTSIIPITKPVVGCLLLGIANVCVTPEKIRNTVKSKHIIATIAVVLTGWLASSQINGVQAKYEQDVEDYQAVVAGDTLPLQARMEKASPRQSIIDLSNAIQHFRKEHLAEAAPTKEVVSGDAQGIVDRLLNTAYSYLGVRYRSGQSGPDGVDCSGFTSFVYKQNNLSLTRSSRSQFTEGQPIAMVSDLRKGDLVFFGGRSGRGGVGHVGIVTEVNREAGSFKFIHASISSGIKVDSSTDAYYSRRYVGARRIVQ